MASENYERARNTSALLPTTSDGLKSFYTLIVDGDSSDEQDFDPTERYIPFDLVKNVSVSMSSEVTSYPLINGDILSDHMYTKPKSISLGAVFSINGRNRNYFAEQGNGTERLENIEAYFETLQKMGRTMTLIAITHDESGNSTGDRFLRTPNLVISSSRFEYGYNSMEVSLTLQEVYFFDSAEIAVWEDEGDPNLPSIRNFEQLDFGQDVLTDESIYDLVIKTLADNGLIAKSWGEWFADFGKSLLASASISTALIAWRILKMILLYVLKKATGVVLSVLLKSTLGATIAATASNPYTLVFGIGIGVIVGVAMLVNSIIKAVKRSKLISEFKYHEGDEEANKAEYNRLMLVCSTTQQAFSDYANNNNLMFYSLSSNRNKIDAYLTIDSAIYDFYFETNSQGLWTLKVSQVNKTDINVSLRNNSIMYGNANVLSLKKDDYLFKVNKTKVYLINKGYAYNELDQDSLEAYLNNLWKSGGCDFLGYTKKEQQENKENPPTSELMSKFKDNGIYKDLTQFIFLVTDENVEKLSKKLKDTLYNCLKKKAYE